MIMAKDYSPRPVERSIDLQKQKAIFRYKQLRKLKKSELSLDDELFLANFRAAVHYIWDWQSSR